MEKFLDHLRALKYTEFKTVSPRQAMGWTQAKEIDKSIRKMIADKKIFEVDQKAWLNNHSGMMIPTEDLRQHIYKDVIMDRYIKPYTGFGKY